MRRARVLKGPLKCWHVQLSDWDGLYWFDHHADALKWAVRMVGA